MVLSNLVEVVEPSHIFLTDSYDSMSVMGREDPQMIEKCLFQEPLMMLLENMFFFNLSIKFKFLISPGLALYQSLFQALSEY